MKRTWIGVGVLALLLAVVAGVGPGSDDAHDAESRSQVADDAGRPSANEPRRTRRRPRMADADDVESPDASDESEQTYRGGPIIQGVVVLPDGEPVPGAFIALGDLDWTEETTLAGADGRFAIDIFASYCPLHAVGLVEGKVWRGESEADGGPLDLTVTLREPRPSERVVLVRVLGPDGAPVPSARAVVAAGALRREWSIHDDYQQVSGGWFAVDASRWRPSADDPVYFVHAACDADGAPLPFGSALIAVNLFDPVQAVRLPQGGGISGTVTTHDGRPATGTTVGLRPPLPEGFDSDHMDAPTLSTETDREGRFEFTGLSPGAGMLWVAAGEETGPGGVMRGVATGTTGIEFVLREAVSTRLRITGLDGTPLNGVSFWLRGDGAAGVSVSADGEGEYVLAGIADGAPVALDLNAGGCVPLRIKEWTPRPHEVETFVMQPSSPIRGRVVTTDGRKLEHVPILGEPWDVRSLSWDEDADGPFFVIEHLPHGTAVTLALSDGEQTFAERRAIAGESDVVLRWPDRDELTIVLAWLHNFGARGVRVLSEGRGLASKPASGLVASFPTAGLPPRVDLQIGPDPDGAFVWLTDVPSRGVLAPEAVTWTGNALRGRLVAPAGADVGFAKCTLRTSRGFEVTVEADRDGKFKFRGFPPGPVVLTASITNPAATGRLELAEKTIERVWRDVVLELKPR